MNNRNWLSANLHRFQSIRMFSILLSTVALIIYAAYLVHAIYVDRALYADGANFFIELLTNDSSWPIADDSKHIRLFVNILNQLPVVLALDFGVTNLRALRILFGVGLFITPLIFYLYCLYLSRKANDYRVLFFSIVSLITCAIPSDIFILNQAFTSLSLAWVIVHYLLLNLKIKWNDWIIVFIISFILFRSHEGLILWGLIFFIGSICLVFFRDRFIFCNQHLIIYIIGLIGTIQASFALFWLSSHPISDQTSAYLQLINLLNPSQLWAGNTRISLLMAISVLIIFASQVKLRSSLNELLIVRIVLSFSLLLVLILMLITGFSALSDFSLTDPWKEFSYRFLITFGATGWMMVSVVFVLVNKSFRNNIRALSTIVLSIGIISTSLWQISNNLQWSTFANTSAYVLRSASVSILDPIEVRKELARRGHENAYKYQWSWAWPVFGMSLQDSGEVERLFKPDGYEKYFNPPKYIPFIPMSGGEIGSEGAGLFRFDHFSRFK
jgi:hypothetical protein